MTEEAVTTKPARILNRQHYRAGHILMREGDPGQIAYYIESGRVRVFSDRSGKQVTLAELGAGSVVGEMAVITQDPRSASVEVMEDSVIVKITAHDFEQKVKKMERVFQALLKILIARLKNANARME